MKTERPDTRLHILDCGQQLVASKGFIGVGLAEILASAGVPKGSFYHYFTSKEAFGAALLEHYFAAYLARIDTLFATPGLSGAERMTVFFSRWIENQSCSDAVRKCLIVKLAAEVSDLSEPMRNIMLGGIDHLLVRLADGIAAGLQDGSIRTGKAPADLAQWLYQMWMGASLLAKLRRDRGSLELALRNTRELLGLD